MSYADDPVTYTVVNGQTVATFGRPADPAYGLPYSPTSQFTLTAVAGTNGVWVPTFQPTAPVVSGAALSTSTGVNPNETAYSLYGHIIPLSVFGVGRIGGEIIAGPWIDTATGLASFCISFGVPADPSGSRDLREIAFDSEVVWTAAGGFTNLAFTYRFYDGTLTQAPDALEVSHFGADAVAYRPQILIWFENLPLASTKFHKIPYVAAVIGDSSGDDVNLGEAFERLAYSPWVGYTSAQFETVDITDGLVSGGLILAQDYDFLGLIQLFGRFYPTWDILQTDKLRIVDQGDAVTADIALDTTRLMGQIATTRAGADTVKKDLELSTIDPAADYTIIPFVAQQPTDPIAVTTSIGRDSVYLPAIMDASTRASIATFAKYHEEMTRKTISGTAMIYGLEMEPGDLVSIRDLGDDFSNETFKVTETLHGANYSVEFTAAAILKCSPDSGLDLPPPPPLGGLIGWWDASVYSSMVIGGGGVVTSIADLSGHGNHLSSGGGPQYSATAFNGLPGLYFPTTSTTGLTRSSYALGTTNTLMCFAAVLIYNTAGVEAGYGRIISYTAPGEAHDADNLGGFALYRNGFTSNVGFFRVVGPSVQSTGYTPRRVIATVASDGTLSLYVDGNLTSTAATAANFVPGGDMFLGFSLHDSTVLGGEFDGVIAEAGVANTFYDAAAVADLDTYLKDKWGL